MYSIIVISFFFSFYSYAADKSSAVHTTQHDQGSPLSKVITSLDQHNAFLRGVDGSEIMIGKKLGIEKEIIATLEAQLENYDLSAQQSIYVAIPFHTAQLDTYMTLLIQHGKMGASIHCFINTRILQGVDGKATIDRLANVGFVTVYNSSTLHDKGFLKLAVPFEKSEKIFPSSEKATVSGILFLGSGNLGSHNAATKNEEGWIKTRNPKTLLEAQAVFKGYAKNSQIYEGEEISYTPKKLK